ncbi:hypothetical protein QCM80_43935 [Bradyrhizobium sp. SSUT112]|uniref:hypothetical protein n=1 Tax=Bradyrhizobium sp. SSUT112 TaxID=3040604 RepID=UPI00244B0DC7|nr:hypothetical protein [Bradyrhizobium sp. SSUT112]MDH2357454.1 hypothetical protein [Bradyrhizobium sp. SSUT112]
MSRISICAAILGMLGIVSRGPDAHATPSCMRDIKPYKLAGDTIEWVMTIAPGSDCIQGLRWSTMQIYSLTVAEQPANGELVLVGPGFRYFANSDFSGTDKFTLVVVGKNRSDEGTSTLQITVSGPGAPVRVGAVDRSE